MKTRGFTLLEVAIIVAIVTILVTILLTSFSSLNARQSLDSSAELVRSVLERAQSLTLASEADAQYGVHFDANQVVLFKGATYSVDDPNNATSTLNARVIISNTTLSGGGSDVLFNRLTGNTSQYGTTTLSLINSSTTQRKVIINQTGTIQVQ